MLTFAYLFRLASGSARLVGWLVSGVYQHLTFLQTSGIYMLEMQAAELRDSFHGGLRQSI